jgi:hypothetical protein
MRTFRMTLSMIMLFTAATAMAQAPQSFKSIATGGTIDDNLDISFDPIELRFIDGMHFYTNLSNLTSSTERLMDNTFSNNEFLLGVSLPNPWVENLWTAAAWQIRNTENSNFIGIDPDWTYGNMAQENGTGMLNYRYYEFRDLDGDGDWDREESVFQEFTDYTTSDKFGFTLNNSYLTDMGTFGLMIARRSQVSSGDRSSAGSLGSGALGAYVAGSQTFSRSVTERDVSGTDPFDDLTWSESGAFETTNTNADTWVNMAYMTEWNEYEVRGDFGYNSESDLIEGSDRYHGEIEDFDPTIIDYIDTYRETDTFEEKQNEEGSAFTLGGSIRETFQQGTTRLDDGYWQAGLNLQFGGCDYEASDDARFTSNEEFFDGAAAGGTDYVEQITETELASDKGTADDFGFGLWTVYNRQLSDNLTFGFGAGWSSSSTTRSTDYVVDYRKVEDLDYTDPLTNDRVITETESFGADRSWERTSSQFNCPVGLEYRTGKRGQWAWRCGSRFTRTAIVTTDDLKAVDSQCQENTVFTQWSDGTETTVITDNMYGSSKEEVHNTFSSTSFYYGMGYTPTDNLQIDMIYMFGGGFDLIDSDFFRDLRISITLNN